MEKLKLYSSRCITDADWEKVKHFSKSEFRSPDKMGYEFILWLDKLRTLADVPIFISSSYRSPEYNKRIGGASNSAHCDIPCNAVDIPERPRTDDPSWNYTRYKIVQAAIDLGCCRIGLYNNGSIHLDLSTIHPKPRLWRVVK